MKETRSVHSEEIRAFAAGGRASLAPTPASGQGQHPPLPAWARPTLALAVGAVLLALAGLALLRTPVPMGAPAPAAEVPVEAPAPAAHADPAPTVPAPTAEPQIGVGFTPGERSSTIAAGAPRSFTGIVTWVNSAKECLVELPYTDQAGNAQIARAWGACADLGINAPDPTPAPTSPPPPPAPVYNPPAAPAVVAPAPPPVVEAPATDLQPIPTQDSKIRVVVDEPGNFEAVAVPPAGATPAPTPHMGNRNGGGGSWGQP